VQGFGGTNAHAILESYGDVHEHEDPVPQIKADTMSLLPLVFSAASEKSLRSLVQSYQAYLEMTPSVDLRSLAYTLACRRTAHIYKTSISIATYQQACSEIDNLLSGDASKFAVRSANANGAILGVFTGQGAQWPEMGAKLLKSSPYVQSIISELDDALNTLPEADRPTWTIAGELQAGAQASRVGEAAIAQPLTCAVQLVLIDLLGHAGIRFHSVVGHSSGEIAAAHASGFLHRRDAIRIAYYRGLHSRLAGSASGQLGAMLAVGTSLEDAQELCSLEDFAGRVVVAASNSATSVTLSGDADAIEEVQTILEEEGKFVRLLRVDKAYHSHHMQRASQPFLSSLSECSIIVQSPKENSPKWFSSVRAGHVLDAAAGLEGQYWTDNLNSPVLFSQAVEAVITSEGPFDVALEVGPHPALKGPASEVYQQVTGKAIGAYFGTLTRAKDDVSSISKTLGDLWTVGVEVDFFGLQKILYEDAGSIHLLRDLPTYPWDHDRAHWSEARSARLLREQEGRYHDLLGTREADGTDEEWRWRNLFTPKELPWLADHALQGQLVFPATGYFCLGVEAAMQVAHQRSVQLVEITDIHVRKAIAVDEKVGTETLVSLTNIRHDDEELTASFACFSTVSRESTQLALNATANVRLTFGPGIDDILAPRTEPAYGMQRVDTDHFYAEVAKLGYNYGPTFRGITSLERKLGSSKGTIVGPPNNDTGTPLLFHPGMLDAALQGLLCGFSSPGDGRLWSLHAPSTIRKVTLVPSICSMAMTPEVVFDCTVTDVEFNKVTGDVEVYQSDTGFKSISVEGVGFIPFSAASELDDKHLFAHDVYDVEAPSGERALGGRRATPAELLKGLDCERVAFYYLRTLKETVDPSERDRIGIEPHHEALFDYADHVCDIVSRSEHAYVKPEWQQDTYEEIQAIMKRYSPDDPDFVLTAASGENLPASVRKETTILEHMTKDDKLNKFYEKALGFVELNRLMSNMVHSIAHRFPNMNICEIGAGTGGASRGIFAKLGTAYASYTYTDISSGFFGKAQENFAAYKDRIIYKTLDITRDPREQGFVEEAYDVVVAANVLHATPDLEATLRHVRTLLKPGGYLVMMEFVDDSVMRLGVIIGGLPGWWVGRDSGRKWSPNVSLPEWNDLLLRSGFAGVDTSTPVLDPLVMPAAIIACQAVDNDMKMLRQPTKASEEEVPSRGSQLVLLGGSNPKSCALSDDLLSGLTRRYKSVLHAKDWKELQIDQVGPNCSFINLGDLDEPFWTHITVERFEKLKHMLLVASNIMWITWGADRDNADGAMTLGFFRSLRYERPEAQLQVIDLEGPDMIDPVDLRWRSMVLEVTAEWRKKGSFHKKLWTTEPELRIRHGEAFIPRVMAQAQQNDRYNSAKREILKDVGLREAIVTLNWADAERRYTLHEEETATLPRSNGKRRIRVDSSLLCSIVTSIGNLFFSLGTDMDTNERILAASRMNASHILVPAQWSVPVEIGRSIDSQYLSFLSGYLLSRTALATVPRGSSVVVHEADPGLASMMSRKLLDHGCKVLFTTSEPGVKRRNWVSLHPFAQTRQIRSSLPSDTSLYFDLSSATAEMSGDDRLGVRIAANLPKLCQTFEASMLIGRESKIVPGSHDFVIHDMLESANLFAMAQTNGVPDGMPLRMCTLRQIISKINSPDMMSIVHWGGESTVPVRVEPIQCRNDLFRGDKTYWLIGLAGDLGRSICDFMITQGARHVVLTSRNPQPDARWVQEYEDQGIEVVYLRGDITSKEDLEQAHKTIQETMPPIAGVANGALVLRDKGLINMDLATFHANTRPKVEGTTYLDEMFPDDSLDWFIAFSSISATVGNMGQMAYTAANIFMKALIQQRRARGVAGSTIDVSQVFGVGYIEREMKLQSSLSREQATRLMHRSGTLIMSEPDLHQLFAEAIVAGRPGSGVNPEIITGVKTLNSQEATEALWAGHPRFGHFIRNAGSAKIPSATKSDTLPVKTQLEKCKDVDEMAIVLRGKLSYSAIFDPTLTNVAALVSKLKSSLMMSDESVSDTTPLIDLGVDSLVAVEVRTWFAQELGADVAVLKILGGPSVHELVEDVIAKATPSLQTGGMSTPRSGSDGEASGTGSSDTEIESQTSLESEAKGVEKPYER
jgi:malonyl CoA-acyl carrier protein transacylase/SAM-dependent methyltransferase/NAD(P)-dependent dehydrogenase (short-subunit alcohol dehydrogenase family)